MTATLLAQTAYGAAAAPVRTARGSELAAFEAITARLARATEPSAPMVLRAAALHDNRRLWTALATDLAGADNALPQGLRAQLFYLAEFSLVQSRAALRDVAALQGLIDVNRAVMRGLAGEAGTA
ncbi:flagellar biosynthesis regulator FlaF [Roseicyclus mahoneyensis]|uniref:Flagellar protein FlaF n=1 Tax=Roseicyclus mahoneyensis TaxID=164332 RepID=A0A316GFR1_9RHOB|nr:flagellar biosynthesis regulator FlaF [Roseicyclus mahoneyensis]PWK59790.1 flagellar protein FlaF [Roseicyclus mahoneyensis]